MSDRIAPNDPVEAEMGEGTVLRRDKVVARNLALICLAMFLVFGAVSIAYMRGWGAERSALTRWVTYLLVPFSAWIGLTKTVLRTVVTTSEIHVQQGLRGAHIPIAAITASRVFESGRAKGGTELFFPAGGKGILVEWRDEGGKDRKTLIGSDDAPGLLASVEQARRARADKLRIAQSSSKEPQAAAEDESPAEEAREEAKRADTAGE